MEVTDSPCNTQQIASNERAKAPPSDVRMCRALPGEILPSEEVLACLERANSCTASGNPTAKNTVLASGSRTSPLHGFASGKEVAFYRGGEPSTGTSFEDLSSGDDLMIQMAEITLGLLRGLSTRKVETHAKAAIGPQRRSHRFAQKARRARRWIYRAVQQKGLAIARQQIQKLETLDGQAERSTAMADGPGPVWALTQRHPISIRIPSTLARVMRFLPEGVKRSINRCDRADLARVIMALVNCWVSGDGGEGALTTWGSMRPLAGAETAGKIVEVEQIME
ncbi:hypothetical protein NYO67_4580 [Aspergillus flavus]|nr:hypothetical protein NYO67_4580 [Aspergillus flavus]